LNFETFRALSLISYPCSYNSRIHSFVSSISYMYGIVSSYSTPCMYTRNCYIVIILLVIPTYFEIKLIFIRYYYWVEKDNKTIKRYFMKEKIFINYYVYEFIISKYLLIHDSEIILHCCRVLLTLVLFRLQTY